ncbi:alcohol dehydrogenase catalytic domain-containing protein [Rhodococcoides yunnanense]|uniref:alcohol dehydrogenase catalytic domain-containing protein n=1 Tax=Rhodococcoides yunnanense TaxID=278209 RepID=UPI0009346E7C|nr:alcohol dehydrogenase catalytic domain-containing protein [Rhodococcus yunnanensis]
MKAWQFTRTHAPLVLRDLPDPVAVPGEVVLDVRAAGLCHSDVGFLEEDDYPLPAPLPVTLGHETAGVVSAVGEGVEGFSIGDRVGIANVGSAVPGIMRDGGFARKVVARADALVHMPASLAFEQAALAADAGASAHHAVMVSGEAGPGVRIGIIGFGGLGQIGARIAVLAGAEVYVAEIKEETWPLAREFGAIKTVRDIAECADDHLDVIVDFAGFGTTTAAAIETVRRGGRVVQAGMAKKEATVNIWLMVMKQISLVATMGGTKEDLESVYGLLASGELDPKITTITFDDIPAGLDQLSRGTADGRLVALMEN